MRLEDIRTIAKSRGIKIHHLSKPELIKAIQTEEGNFDCFGSAPTAACATRRTACGGRIVWHQFIIN